MVRNDNTVSVRQAATLVHKQRKYIRLLIEDGKLNALKVGGTIKRPRLRIDVDELKAAVKRDQTYVPQGMTRTEVNARRRASRSSSSGVHPVVQDW